MVMVFDSFILAPVAHLKYPKSEKASNLIGHVLLLLWLHQFDLS